jgi:hypothetical protein
MSPVGLGTKNDSAGEGQKQFTLPTDRPIQSWVLNFIVSSSYPATTSEQTEDFMRAVVMVIYRVQISDPVIVIFIYEL